MTEFGMIGEMNGESRTFLQSWQTQLDFVNASMRAIRKVQTDCEVLRKCISSPEILQGVHDGVVFDKHMKSDGTYTYMVYLHQIRVLSRINTLENLHNYGAYQFNMFVFEDETHIHKKIRLQRCANE